MSKIKIPSIGWLKVYLVFCIFAYYSSIVNLISLTHISGGVCVCVVMLPSITSHLYINVFYFIFYAITSMSVFIGTGFSSLFPPLRVHSLLFTLFYSPTHHLTRFLCTITTNRVFSFHRQKGSAFFPIHSLPVVLPLILVFSPYSPLPLTVSHHHRLHHSLLQSNFLKFPRFSPCSVRRGGSAFTQCAGVDAT